MPRYTFGPFSLDPEARVLLREGEPVPIAGKTLDTLWLLIQNRGRLVDKDELLSQIWAGSVVEEANLTQSIWAVRKILGDNPKEHRYIATVAGRGYQFVAPVTEVSDQPKQRTPEGRETHPLWNRNSAVLAGLLALLIIAAGAVWFSLRRPAGTAAELVEQQLTFNSGASTVLSAAISRDGRYLAYSDLAGIHIRLLETSEERMLPAPAGVSSGALFYVDSWFPDGTQLLMNSEQPGQQRNLWTISVMGQSPRELRTDAEGWSVSPDGSLIAFTPDDKPRELWLMDSHGEGAKRILELPATEWLRAVRWSPDGHSLAYIRGRITKANIETRIEACDLRGTNRTTVAATIPEDWVLDLSWLDGRIVYGVQEGYGLDSSLWQVAVDTHSRTVAGKPGRITQSKGYLVFGLSASADGKRLVLCKVQIRSQAYLGELEPGGKSMRPPRRLSNNEAENSPSAWTSDSKAVLFASNRNGKWGIFKQAITADSAEPLATGMDVVDLPRLSPDGAWVLYIESSGLGETAQHRIMRVPVQGGLPQFVLEVGKYGFDFSCARAPATFCTIFEGSSDPEHWLLTAVDPVEGRGKLLRTTPAGGSASGLAPDGSTFAVAKRNEAETHIRLLSLTGRPDREIVLKSWPALVGLDWSADGKGLYCGFTSPRGGTLVYVELNGATHVLWHSTEVGANAFLGGIPSPDGRSLAIWGSVKSGNAWLLEGF